MEDGGTPEPVPLRIRLGFLFFLQWRGSSSALPGVPSALPGVDSPSRCQP
jgi:hypothetical protein